MNFFLQFIEYSLYLYGGLTLIAFLTLLITYILCQLFPSIKNHIVQTIPSSPDSREI